MPVGTIKRLDFRTPHLLRDEAEYDAAVAEIDEQKKRPDRPGSTTELAKELERGEPARTTNGAAATSCSR